MPAPPVPPRRRPGPAGPLAAEVGVTENDTVAVGEGGAPLPGDDRPGLPGVDYDEVIGEGGSAALLQGLMSMLGEVLGGLDRRMANLEESVAGQRGQEAPAGPVGLTADGEALAGAVANLEAVAERLERVETALSAVGDDGEDDDMVTVVTALERLAVDVERMETAAAGASPDEPPAVLAHLDRLSERLERVETALLAVGEDGEDDDDMVTLVAALDGVTERLGRLEARGATDPTLDAALQRLDALSGAVDTIGYGLATLADVVTSSRRGDELEELKGVLATLAEDVAELRRSTTVEPLEGLYDVVGRLEQQIRVLSGQPGPGPALAMVAAGLAQRFEERTQGLIDLLLANADYERRLWERLEELLDGGSFDELVVGEALEHVIGNQELLSDSLQRALESGIAQAADVGAVQRTLGMLSSSVQDLEAGLDDVRGRLAELAGAFEWLRPGPESESQPGVGRFGRRAGRAGRRLASDLGLRGREGSARPPSEGPTEPGA